MNFPAHRANQIGRIVTGLAAAFLVAACEVTDVTPDTANQPEQAERQAIRAFSNLSNLPFLRSNKAAAEDILDLIFQLEGGQELARMTRFERPVAVSVAGKHLTSIENRDLSQLLSALRSRSGIDIKRSRGDEPGNLAIEFVAPREFQRLVPNAACFVAPRVATWAEYKAARRANRLAWSTLQQREQMAIFLPNDAGPQDIRDCLHEEIAQALGPTNDLYRLADSVFNDDDYHRILTGFDYLVLRAIYHPSLESGMSKPEVAARLSAILNASNPTGRFGGTSPQAPTSKSFENAISDALGRTSRPNQRLAAIQTAVTLARPWGGLRLGFALHSQGRLLIASNGKDATRSFRQALDIFSGSKVTELQWANTSLQLIAFYISTGDLAAASSMIVKALPIATLHQDAQLVARLTMFQWRLAVLKGNKDEARRLELDSLAWARYGLGDLTGFRREMAEVSMIGRASEGGS